MGTPETLIQIGLVGEALEQGPIGVLIADENMRYIGANDYVCRLLGYTRSELLQLKVTDVARTPDAPSEYAEMMKDGIRVGSTELTRKNGSVFRAGYRASETSVVGMMLYISALWAEEEG